MDVDRRVVENVKQPSRFQDDESTCSSDGELSSESSSDDNNRIDRSSSFNVSALRYVCSAIVTDRIVNCIRFRLDEVENVGETETNGLPK